MEFVEMIGKYALSSIIMGLIVMILVGFIKLFTKVAYKGEESEKRKAWLSKLYLFLALLFSVGVVFAYYLIFKFELDTWSLIKDIALTYTCTQTIYPIYRKYGGRTLFLKILSLFKGKNDKTDEIIKIIEEIVMLSDEQKEALKEKL